MDLYPLSYIAQLDVIPGVKYYTQTRSYSVSLMLVLLSEQFPK